MYLQPRNTDNKIGLVQNTRRTMKFKRFYF